MNFITHDQLKSLLLGVKAAAPVTILTKTVPNCRKTGNPYNSGLYKYSRINGFISFNYETSIRKQEILEGTCPPSFNVSPRAWGDHKNSCLIENKGEYYLQIKVIKARPPYYFHNGKRLSKKALNPFLIIPPEPNQPVEKKTICRTYKLANIRTIIIGGTRYRVKSI